VFGVAGRWHHAQREATEGALAAPALPNQGDDLAFVDVQVDAIEAIVIPRLGLAKKLRGMPKLQKYEAPAKVKDGVNIPRYPSVPGRIKARKKPIDTTSPTKAPARLEKLGLALPPQEVGTAEVIGTGPDAAPKVVEILKEIGVLA